jgi:3-deoxy-D-arabino-heptulosonate 7-phosphate (DAHP) synthase class II
VTPYLIREWQKLSGEFVPKNVEKLCGYYEVADTNPRLVRAITKQKHKVLCINDANEEIDVSSAGREIREAFERILPKKSSFEL